MNKKLIIIKQFIVNRFPWRDSELPAVKISRVISLLIAYIVVAIFFVYKAIQLSKDGRILTYEPDPNSNGLDAPSM